MAARTFADSTGATWEVFEVHRASDKPGAVSAGLEHGWLAFVNGDEKRRLAPFPSDWAGAGDTELERLCAQARLAARTVFERPLLERRRVPRDTVGTLSPNAIPTETPAAANGVAETQDAGEVAAPAAENGHADMRAVEDVVRVFAREAQRSRTPAVAAMVRLKTMLAERFPGPEHVARNSRLVRRWFVESYYFQRDA